MYSMGRDITKKKKVFLCVQVKHDKCQKSVYIYHLPILFFKIIFFKVRSMSIELKYILRINI